MQHKKISVSVQVNKLSLPARLLFTWMISHADDEGRLKGDPEYVKATVIPMAKWSFKLIKNYLEEIKNQGLIYYWEENSEWFIEFVKWLEHQTIRKDRLIPSSLPSFNRNNDNHLSTKGQPDDNQETPQDNISELNEIEVNKSEYNLKEDKTDIFIADKNSYKDEFRIINPKTFTPGNEVEVAAHKAWNTLEPNNPIALQSTYLKAAKLGLPPTKFYEFVSEIKQDPTINNKGAVFNQKLRVYLDGKTME